MEKGADHSDGDVHLFGDLLVLQARSPQFSGAFSSLACSGLELLSRLHRPGGLSTRAWSAVKTYRIRQLLTDAALAHLVHYRTVWWMRWP